MSKNIAVLALNEVEADTKVVQYMQEHQTDGNYAVYTFQKKSIEGMVNEIVDQCQDVLLVYDSEEGVNQNFNMCVQELHENDINPLLVVSVHDGYYLPVDDAETLVLDAVCAYDPEYNSLMYTPRVVYFNEEKGFSLEPKFEEEINIDFMMME